MTDYNFAKNYENIKDWEFKNQSPSFTEADNFVDQLLKFSNAGCKYISFSPESGSSNLMKKIGKMKKVLSYE